jgi:hypothetical protein
MVVLGELGHVAAVSGDVARPHAAKGPASDEPQLTAISILGLK